MSLRVSLRFTSYDKGLLSAASSIRPVFNQYTITVLNKSTETDKSQWIAEWVKTFGSAYLQFFIQRLNIWCSLWFHRIIRSLYSLNFLQIWNYSLLSICISCALRHLLLTCGFWCFQPYSSRYSLLMMQIAHVSFKALMGQFRFSSSLPLFENRNWIIWKCYT